MILILLFSAILSLTQFQIDSEPVDRWLVEMDSPKSDCIELWWTENGFNQSHYLKKALPIDNWMVIEIPTSYSSSLANLHCIRRIMEDQRIEWRNTIPNDPAYINQGDMNLIGMPKAWDISTGGVTTQSDTIVIAVVDDGYDIDHMDLIQNIWLNRDEIPEDQLDNDGNGYIDDYKGLNVLTGKDDHPKHQHGTQVCGVLGAKGNNALGVTGVNWNVKLMLISNAGYESEVIEAYQYALDMRKKYNDTDGAEGAFVVATNLSGGIDFEFAQDHPLWCEMYDKLGEAGILSVVAAPNHSISVDEEGDMPTTCTSQYMIAVTNVDQTDVLWDNAGYGATSIDIGAPGEGTLTVDVNNQYGDFSGTSSAAPHVTGAIALIYSSPCTTLLANIANDPALVALQIRDLIFATAKPNNSLQGVTFTGKRVQVDEALRQTQADCGIIIEEGVRIVSISPNPVSLDYTRIQFEVIGDTSTASFELYAINGALIITYPISVAEFQQGYIDLDTKPLASAIYLLTLRNKSKKATSKLFVY